MGGFRLFGGHNEVYRGQPARETFVEGLVPKSTTGVTAVLDDGRRLAGRLVAITGDNFGYFIVPFPNSDRVHAVEAHDRRGVTIDRITIPA
ncbi:MAG: hypothetical protein ACJ735_06220 [Actinomycetes bacterium]